MVSVEFKDRKETKEIEGVADFLESQACFNSLNLNG